MVTEQAVKPAWKTDSAAGLVSGSGQASDPASESESGSEPGSQPGSASESAPELESAQAGAEQVAAVRGSMEPVEQEHYQVRGLHAVRRPTPYLRLLILSQEEIRMILLLAICRFSREYLTCQVKKPLLFRPRPWFRRDSASPNRAESPACRADRS